VSFPLQPNGHSLTVRTPHTKDSTPPAKTRPEKLGRPFTRWSIRKLVAYVADNPVRVVWGAAAPARSWEEIERRFGVKIREGYGMTEASNFTMINVEGRVGSIGRPLPYFEVRIVGEDGQPLGPRQVEDPPGRDPTHRKGSRARKIERGHEIAGHTYDHRPPWKLSEAEEREDVRKTIASIQEVTGARIVGWRCPRVQPSASSVSPSSSSATSTKWLRETDAAGSPGSPAG